MGMFDSMYDRDGNEWQTKAFDCELYRMQIGETVPHPSGISWPAPDAYQVMVYGGPRFAEPARGDAYATIINGDLSIVPSERIQDLPLIDYHGGWAAEPKEN